MVGEGVGGHGAAEVVALGVVAAQQIEVVGDVGGFDAFGEDGDLEAFGHLDDGADDGAGVGVGGEVADEGLVDLELFDGEAAQVGEAGVAGAEVPPASE